MSTSYTHFTAGEREKLLQFKAQGLKQIEMAQKLGRSRSSVSRELKRNSREDGSYSAFEAEEKYRQRRKRSVRKRRLDNEEPKNHVAEKLHDYWSPEQIEGRLKLEHSSFQISFAERFVLSGAGINSPRSLPFCPNQQHHGTPHFIFHARDLQHFL